MRFTNCFDGSQRSRRHFFQATAVSTLVSTTNVQAAETGANLLGPMPGYSPQIGTLVSEMAWMREAVLRATKGMTLDQLDFLLDNKANRIGALLLHLAATEKLYQLNTFGKVAGDELEKSPAFKDWVAPMELGRQRARRSKVTTSTTI
jgi:hypothetical protein